MNRDKFPTSFLDKNGNRIKEGDYIAVTKTKTMNNHYYNGMGANGRTFTNREPYKEWKETGTVIREIVWHMDVMSADKVATGGKPHPSMGTDSCLLNWAFKSEEYEIIGSKYDNTDIRSYISSLYNSHWVKPKLIEQ